MIEVITFSISKEAVKRVLLRRLLSVIQQGQAFAVLSSKVLTNLKTRMTMLGDGQAI